MTKKTVFTRCAHCGGPVSIELDIDDVQRSVLMGSLLEAIQQAIKAASGYNTFKPSEIRVSYNGSLRVDLDIFEPNGHSRFAILDLGKSALDYLAGVDRT